jgi:small subunit ribosomal protein S16
VLRIRLRRVGKKKQPQYRIVVADSRAPRDGAFIETIGTYNPLTNPATITLDEDKAKAWLGKGAMPSDRAVKILAGKGLVPAPVFAPKPKKAEAPAEQPATAKPAAVEKPAAAAEPPAETPAEQSAEADTETADASA